MNKMAPTLEKRERMVSRKLIETLFGGGSSMSMAAFPLRAVYMRKAYTEAGEAPVQVLVSVSKKRFKHAVDRNRVKRQIREAYRKHKQLLYDALPATDQLLIAFIWLSEQHCPTQVVDKRVGSLIQRVSEKL